MTELFGSLVELRFLDLASSEHLDAHYKEMKRLCISNPSSLELLLYQIESNPLYAHTWTSINFSVLASLLFVIGVPTLNNP